MQFAKIDVNIIQKDIEVIFHSIKSLLHNNGSKRKETVLLLLFGAYDGAEICELTGIFLMTLIGKKYDSENIRLCRDDGLDPNWKKLKNTQRKYSKKKC